MHDRWEGRLRRQRSEAGSTRLKTREEYSEDIVTYESEIKERKGNGVTKSNAQ